MQATSHRTQTGHRMYHRREPSDHSEENRRATVIRLIPRAADLGHCPEEQRQSGITQRTAALWRAAVSAAADLN